MGPASARALAGPATPPRLGLDARGALAALVCVALAMFAMFAVGGDVVRSANASDGDLDLALLGALECDSAFTVPSSERGVDRHSYTFTKLVSMADFIYILCVGCESIRVPSAWRGKVLLVDGKVIDECMQDYALDHWHRATFSHAIAVAHARSKGYEVAAVVEDDARSDFTLQFTDQDYDSFNATLQTRELWTFIRLGYRPCELEQNGNQECSDRCQCEKVDERMRHRRAGMRPALIRRVLRAPRRVQRLYPSAAAGRR